MQAVRSYLPTDDEVTMLESYKVLAVQTLTYADVC
jgi:hypothetical protein